MNTAGSAGSRTPDAYDAQLQTRRREYLEWIIDTFADLEPGMKPADGRLWSLNHARLCLDRGTDEAGRYLAQVALPRDRDFMGIRLAKTLFDFRESPRLTEAAREHLETVIRDWEMNSFSRLAKWPRQHTENHDIMFLTVGLLSQHLRGQDIGGHLTEVRQWLAWRFERGFYEWNSHRYQFHTSNALQVLAAHAPAEDVRRGAEALFNVMLAERCLLSVGGYLGGCFMRGYEEDRGCDYLNDNRYDAFLPTVWLALGVGEPRFDYARSDGLSPAGDGFGNGRDPRLNQDEGMFFAGGRIVPHRLLPCLLADTAKRAELIYTGKRATAGYPTYYEPPSDWRTNQLVHYYNTPHVSMGSVQYMDGAYPITSKARSRWWSVLFPSEPSQVLRARTDGWPAQRVVQHRNWLVGEGELIATHGLTPCKVGPWNLYEVGKALCAHIEIDGWHVVQVSDTDKHPTGRAFLETLAMPVIDGNVLRGATDEGDSVRVDLSTMALEVNGVPRPSRTDMLHDSPAMRSRYGSGIIEIDTSKGRLVYDASELFDLPARGTAEQALSALTSPSRGQ